jgi:hypothetical protein
MEIWDQLRPCFVSSLLRYSLRFANDMVDSERQERNMLETKIGNLVGSLGTLTTITHPSMSGYLLRLVDKLQNYGCQLSL